MKLLPSHRRSRPPAEEVHPPMETNLAQPFAFANTRSVRRRVARLQWNIRLIAFFVGILLIPVVLSVSPVRQTPGYGGGSGLINPICGHPQQVFARLRPGETYTLPTRAQLLHLPTPKQRPISSVFGATYDPATNQLCVADAAALDANFGPAPSTLAPTITGMGSTNTGGLTANFVISALSGLWGSFQQWMRDSFLSLIGDAKTFGFLFFTPPGLTYGHKVVQHLQAWILLFTDGAFALFMIIAGYNYMFGGYKSFREFVPPLIVAAIVANLGLPILGQFIDVCNTVCTGILGILATVGIGDLTLPFGVFNWVTAPEYLIIVYLIELICVILLCGQMVLRIAFLCLLLVVAPAGLFLCFGGGIILPGARQWGTLWAQAFVATLIAQPLQLLCLGLGAALVGSFGSSSLSPVSMLVGIAALFLAWKIPDLLLSSVIRSRILSTESANEMTQNVMSAAQKGIEMAALIVA
jgi:hypothetical protein